MIPWLASIGFVLPTRWRSGSDQYQSLSREIVSNNATWSRPGTRAAMSEQTARHDGPTLPSSSRIVSSRSNRIASGFGSTLTAVDPSSWGTRLLATRPIYSKIIQLNSGRKFYRACRRVGQELRNGVRFKGESGPSEFKPIGLGRKNLNGAGICGSYRVTLDGNIVNAER